MERLPIAAECYQKCWALQCQVDNFYSEREQVRPLLSKQKEFRSIKNAVIQEAERIRLSNISFEDREMAKKDEAETFGDMSFDCRTLRDIIRDDTLPTAERDDAMSQMERLAKSGDIIFLREAMAGRTAADS